MAGDYVSERLRFDVPQGSRSRGQIMHFDEPRVSPGKLLRDAP
jgi:hypothetical protein